jgi:hypothetical protein
LISLKAFLLRSKGIKENESVKELIIKKFLCFLPEEFISSSLADLLSSVLKEVEDTLHDSGHLEHLELL